MDILGLPRGSVFTLTLLHERILDAGQEALSLRRIGDGEGGRQALEAMQQALVAAFEVIGDLGREAQGRHVEQKNGLQAQRWADQVIARLRFGNHPLRTP
jgi:hypothetical protein